jgi:DNA-binding CsgD family transcriptional regulator
MDQDGDSTLYVAGHVAPPGRYRRVEAPDDRSIVLDRPDVLPASLDGRVAVYVRVASSTLAPPRGRADTPPSGASRPRLTPPGAVHLRLAPATAGTGPRPPPDRRVLDVEAAGVGAWEYDPTTGALYCSERTRALLAGAGAVPDDLGRALLLVHPADRTTLRAAVAAALDPAGDGRCRARFRRAGADGLSCWLEVRGRAEFADGPRGRRARLLRGALLELDPDAGDPRPGRDGDAVDWGPLTPRERDVAALVARGLSNRAIGEALVLAEGTVANHVRRILLRLGLTSRAALAAWVAMSPGRRGRRPAVRPPIGA